MPRAKPKTERSCLCCGAIFMGTPSATRCDPCKSEGNQVPREKQQERRRKPVKVDPDREARRLEREAQRLLKATEREAQVVTKVCLGCGDQYEATRSNSRRCPSCIEEGVRLRQKPCIECGTSFTVSDPSQVRCESCADLLGLDRWELTPEQLEAIREEDRKARWQEQLTAQRRWLDMRENAKIEGYKRMKNTTRSTPIGILWVSLCFADGAASSVMHSTESGLTAAQKLHLLITFYRIRCRGYHPSAIAKLCPKAILEGMGREEYEDGLRDLPEVRADLVAFQEQQNRHIECIRLGLAS